MITSLSQQAEWIITFVNDAIWKSMKADDYYISYMFFVKAHFYSQKTRVFQFAFIYVYYCISIQHQKIK